MATAKLRSPAEWEKQEATWLAFPHHPKNWAGERGVKIRKFYFDLILKIAKFQNVNILVPKDFAIPAEMFKKLAHSKFQAKFIPMPTNDIWIRDYGPFFVKRGDKTEIATTKFNAWGAKFPPFSKDDAVPSRIAKLLGMPLAEVPYIFEGGAIEFNSDGLAMTTLPCLTGKNRNAKADVAKLKAALKKALGLKDILVLPDGLCGDHTDGHIDNVARFVSNERIVMAWEDADTENKVRLTEVKKQIEAWLQKHYGKKAKVDTLQLPPQKQLGAETLPASYMNYIYVNGGLIYPKYYAKLDKVVAEYFKSVYPDREIIGVDCKTVIEEGGSLHCMSKHQSA